MLRFTTLWMAILGAVLAVGCGTDDTGAREQALTGHLDQASFPYTVGSIDVVDGRGAVTTVPVDASGAFRAALRVGGRYQMRAAGMQGDATVIFPRASGKIDSWLAINHAGPAFDVGAVRFVGAMPTVSFKHVSNQQGDAADGDDVECEDGIDPNTGAVCVDDDAEDGCQGEGEGEDDGEQDGDDVECEDGIDANTGAACADDDDGEEADGDDIECEDGIDPNTGAACADDDDGEEDDDAVDGDVAVAEHNPPDGGMCGGEDEDDDGEDDGVDCQQEGEHEGDNEGC